MEKTYDTLVKEVKTKNYTLALIQIEDNYEIYVEHLGHKTYVGNIGGLKNALSMFDELLVQVQGN